MTITLEKILGWSEVWALFIPLGVLLVKRDQPQYLKPVIIYLIVALPLNFVIDLIADFKYSLPKWMDSNTPLYNVQSVVRFVCFSVFFLVLRQRYFKAVRKTVLVLFGLFFLVNFMFFQDFFYTQRISSSLLSAEAYSLLILCMVYYLSQLKEEEESIVRGPDFWVTTGLCVYVVINFFVFLFYSAMLRQDPSLAERIWDVHNIAFIIFCFFIATALYVSPRPQYRT